MNNEQELLNESKQFAGAVTPLLREYRDTLREFRSEVGAFAEKARTRISHLPVPEQNARNHLLHTEKMALMEYYNRLTPALSELARKVSQRLQHSSVDYITETELTVRLAEFEAELGRAQQAFFALHQIS